jgi:hypothetical protein
MLQVARIGQIRPPQEDDRVTPYTVGGYAVLVVASCFRKPFKKWATNYRAHHGKVVPLRFHIARF